MPCLSFVPMLALGCIDPKSDYEDFLKRPVVPREAGYSDVGATPCADLLKQELSGRFFGSCYVSAVMLPFSLAIEQTIRPAPDGQSAELDMTFSALTLTATSLSDTAGEPNVLPTTVIDSECRFVERIGTLTLPAAANSLGRDLTAENVVLRGKIQSADRHCSELDGNVPLVNLSLETDGDVCLDFRLMGDAPLPTVMADDYVCDPSTLPPR
jgi:hypothetical protein